MNESDISRGHVKLEKNIGHVPRVFKELAKTSPEMHDAVLTLDNFIWADNALTRKEKKLIAIAVAAPLRDTHATRAQLTGAKALGVSLAEIDEALRVSFMLSGMPAYVQGITTAESVYGDKKEM